MGTINVYYKIMIENQKKTHRIVNTDLLYSCAQL